MNCPNKKSNNLQSHKGLIRAIWQQEPIGKPTPGWCQDIDDDEEDDDTPYEDKIYSIWILCLASLVMIFNSVL